MNVETSLVLFLSARSLVPCICDEYIPGFIKTIGYGALYITWQSKPSNQIQQYTVLFIRASRSTAIYFEELFNKRGKSAVWEPSANDKLPHIIKTIYTAVFHIIPWHCSAEGHMGKNLVLCCTAVTVLCNYPF